MNEDLKHEKEITEKEWFTFFSSSIDLKLNGMVPNCLETWGTHMIENMYDELQGYLAEELPTCLHLEHVPVVDIVSTKVPGMIKVWF